MTIRIPKQAAALAVGALILLAPFAALAQAPTPVTRVGVFDSKRVFEGTEEGKRLQKFLNDKREELRANLGSKQQEIRALEQKLGEGEFTLADDKKAEIQKDAQRKLVELNSMEQEAKNNLRLEVEDAQAQLERKLVEIVGELGREQGFAMILERNTQVVYAADAVDITPEVVERFNRKYPGSPEGTPKAAATSPGK